jgi:hypothetical protein
MPAAPLSFPSRLARARCILVVFVGTLCSTLFVLTGHAQPGSSPAQVPTVTCMVYATPSASDAWMAMVSRWPLPQQIDALRQRMGCDAGLRPPQAVVCYVPVARGTRIPPLPVDPRPEGIGLFCVLDGYPVDYGNSPTFQHLVTARSIKKLTFVASQEASTLPMGTLARTGVVLITTRTPKATRRQWQLAANTARTARP